MTDGDDIVEFHVCMGLNSCEHHGRDGTGEMAGMGECATVSHTCHGNNSCRAPTATCAS